ncbi:snRNA-activating protein complex subunit 4 [Dissostichus eleginoides]|uniref:snRNA-activating protein complex subunit 4 n=1 Tax=Dissostichus eleginoides TaxID=100907 RepID=A0AAD9EP07_DISEL|nr:snRNA-activating protein complex subunit 4 [Dissostichus eleginoides]
MSVSLSAERDRIQRQVEELEQSLSATNADLQLMSNESDAEDSEEEGKQSAADLLAERERIQQEIQNLENVLGEQSPERPAVRRTVHRGQEACSQEDGSPRTGGLQSGGRFTEDRRPAVRRTVHRGQEACSQEDDADDSSSEESDLSDPQSDLSVPSEVTCLTLRSDLSVPSQRPVCPLRVSCLSRHNELSVPSHELSVPSEVSCLSRHNELSVPSQVSCLSPHNELSSELGVPPSPEGCLQMNLVYQQVLQETLQQLEDLLTNNNRQQKELVSQLSGPIRERPQEQPASSSCQPSTGMYLGRFLKPYFKDKLTSLGPPANQEAREKASRMSGCLDEKQLKIKRWESWQKTLLIHSVSRDSLRKLIQPKLSK